MVTVGFDDSMHVAIKACLNTNLKFAYWQWIESKFSIFQFCSP